MSALIKQASEMLQSTTEMQQEAVNEMSANINMSKEDRDKLDIELNKIAAMTTEAKTEMGKVVDKMGKYGN